MTPRDASPAEVRRWVAEQMQAGVDLEVVMVTGTTTTLDGIEPVFISGRQIAEAAADWAKFVC